MAKKNSLYRFHSDRLREELSPSDYSLLESAPLPCTDELTVMVWNIYKQQRLSALPFLQEYSEDCDLVLLQEAQSTPPLIKFVTEHFHSSDQVPAIKIPNLKLLDRVSGVMTLATTEPIYSRPFRQKEPLLRLSKSALITVYPLKDGRLLLVINVHAINFTLGVEAYQNQIEAISKHVMLHRGPVIFGGDFNTWSRPRLLLLYRFARKMGLRRVEFEDDQRKSVFKNPLDFIFYRDLTLIRSEVISTDASDHNPMRATFAL